MGRGVRCVLRSGIFLAIGRLNNYCRSLIMGLSLKLIVFRNPEVDSRRAVNSSGHPQSRRSTE